MSKIIASGAIRGAHQIVGRVERKWKEAMDRFGGAQEVAFPNTGYYLPIIYGITGFAVRKLEDMKVVLDRCRQLLPPVPQERHHLPYLGPALDAGMAAFFAEECEEAIRYTEDPGFYLPGEVPDEQHPWLGAADDVILRKRGVEFVDGTAPGFAAILGSAPSREVAAEIALELQKKNLYVFMASGYNGTCFARQLFEGGVQVGWNTRLVPFGPDTSATVFAIGFATRAAMSFGGVQPGDFRRILIYNKNRIFAFALTLGEVNDEWYANGAGAINYGFPVIADTPIPQILPTGICTYEHVVSNVPHREIVNRAVEVRGLKVQVVEVPVPVAYGPSFEGERVRGEDIYAEMGGGHTKAVELVLMRDMHEVEDGRIEVVGPDLKDLRPPAKLPLAILVEAAGRKMQEDFEPILERQIHHLINYAQGLMHIGQRDIAWLRVSTAAVEKGFELKHLGSILHAKLHQDFGNIVDKIQVTVFTDQTRVDEITALARQTYEKRDIRVEGMTDETVETYYSCTLCQSFAPNHVCMISPERTGLCGAYNWLDCKASHEINPTGPNQPVEKGQCLDKRLGRFQGVNEFVYKASRQKLSSYNLYSIMEEPMTTCGCCECIAAVLPMCNGIMTVDRDHPGETPCGMKFTTLAGTVGGGVSTPGFVGHSKYYITQRKFIIGDGGLFRLVWMPRRLKEEIMPRLRKAAEELGMPDFPDRIADETVGTSEEEILPWLEEKGHPALKMPPLL